MSDKVVLTPKQCAEQFRMYAKCHDSHDSIHQLDFCAKFLDEFCPGKHVDNVKALKYLDQLRRLLPKHGTNGEEMINLVENLERLML